MTNQEGRRCPYCSAEVRVDWRDLWDYSAMRSRMTWVFPLHSVPASGAKCPRSNSEALLCD